MSQQKPTESNQRVSGVDRADDPQSSTAKPIILQQLNLPLVQADACVVCGAPFEVARQRGRPQKFCSDACRAAQHHQQKTDWNRQQRKEISK